MAIRYKNHYGIPCSAPELCEEFHQDGDTICRKRKFGFEPLPSVDNYDLQKMLDAGLPLEKVSTTIIKKAPPASMLLEKTTTNDDESKQKNKDN